MYIILKCWCLKSGKKLHVSWEMSVVLWSVSLLFVCLYVFHNLCNTHIVAAVLDALVCVIFFFLPLLLKLFI